MVSCLATVKLRVSPLVQRRRKETHPSHLFQGNEAFGYEAGGEKLL